MRFRLVILLASAAQLLVVLDVSVVNIALPSIQSDLSMSTTAGSWIALAYGVTFAGALLVGARLADSIGVVRALAAGVVGFVAASAVGGFADAGSWVIAARAGQGLAAAVVSPATLTLITTSFAQGSARTRALAIWTAVSVAGGGVGNVVSGALVELASWRAVFLINLPIGAVILLAAWRLYRRKPDRGSDAFIDPVAAVLATTSGIAAIYGLSTATDEASSWSSGSLLVAGGLLVALVAQQRRSPRQLIPAAILHRRNIVIGNLAVLLSAGCFQMTIWYMLTYRLQAGIGLSPLAAGLAFLPLTLGLILVNLLLVPLLVPRLGERVLVALGASIAAGGTGWLALESRSLVEVIGPMLIIGLGGGLMNTPLAMLVTTGVRPEHAGAASGAMNTAKQLGGAAGLAAASALSTATGDDLASYLLMSTLLLAAAALMLVMPQTRESDA